MSPTRRCPICVSEYDALLKRPLVLDCGHTFCHECLYRMNGSAYRTCAVCRQSWSDRGVNDLPECYQLLPSDVSSEALHCRPHNSQQLFWCVVCKEKLCRKCLRLQHRTCDWVLIEEQAEDLKAEVITKISETEIKIKDSLSSIDSIIKENKTILDLYKNLRKVLGKMNGEYTIYQQRILLLQSKLNRQTSELENLRTDWAIPPGSDLMCAVRQKMSDLQGVQAVIMWPEKPHMRHFNGLIDNFQKCRDSNYSLTDVCEGLDLPLTDDESEADDDDDENEEEIEEVEQEQEQEQAQEQDSGEEEEEAPNADDSVVTAIERASSENLEPEMTQFLAASSAAGSSTMPTSEAVTETFAASGTGPLHNYVTSSMLEQSTRSVSTQFSLRPVISFFGDSSIQASPFPVSTPSSTRVETTSIVPASAAQPASSSQQQQATASPETSTIGNSQTTCFSTMFGTENMGVRSALNFSSLFAPGNTNTAVVTSVAGLSCSLPNTFPEMCSSASLPKLTFSSLGSQSQFGCSSSLLSMTKPSSKFERNIFLNYSPIQGALFTSGSGTNTLSPASSIVVTSSSTLCQPGAESEPSQTVESRSPGMNSGASESISSSHTNTQAVFTPANGAGTASSSSQVSGALSQGNTQASDGALTTTVFATFKFQPTEDESQTSSNRKILVLDGSSATTNSISCLNDGGSQCQHPEVVFSATGDTRSGGETRDEAEVEAQLQAESNEATADGHNTLSEAGSAPSNEAENNLPSSGVKFKSSKSLSFCTHETTEGGETSTSATENSNSAKKIHLQSKLYENDSESSGDSISSTPRTDTWSRELTDEDSVRGQMRIVQSSDLLSAFKNAMKELRKLKKSLKSSKLSRKKKEAPGNAADCGTEARMVEEASEGGAEGGAEGGSEGVRPKQSGDSACPSARGSSYSPPAAASPRPSSGAESEHHKTLHSEYRKFLRRGGPFRRRLRKDARSCERRVAAASSTAE